MSIFRLEKRPAVYIYETSVRTWQTSVYIRRCVLCVPLCCTLQTGSRTSSSSLSLTVSSFLNIRIRRRRPDSSYIVRSDWTNVSLLLLVGWTVLIYIYIYIFSPPSIVWRHDEAQDMTTTTTRTKDPRFIFFCFCFSDLLCRAFVCILKDFVCVQ